MASLKNKHNLKIEQDIEKYIKAEAYDHQIRIKDFFEDYDKLRKGYITEDKFRTGLSYLKLHLSEENIQNLIARYKDSQGLINYPLFCENVEKQFYDRAEALDNLDAVKSKSIYEDHEFALLQSILKYLRKEISTRRILLKPSFQDFDRINTCRVTYQQFTRALTKLGLDMPDICFKVLARKYMDKNNTRDVNYSTFLKEVDDVNLVKGESYTIPQSLIQRQLEIEQKGDGNFSQSHLTGNGADQFASMAPAEQVDQESNLGFITSAKESSRPEFGGSFLNTVSNIDDLEKKLKAEIVMKKIRLHEFFLDFDNLRKGFITKDQFRRTMELTGLMLSDSQFQMLLDKYMLPNGMFDYATFSKNIKLILTTKGIQKDPLYEVEQITSDTTIPARRYNMKITSDEAHKLNYLQGLIRKEIETRRLLFKPHFQNFDLTNNGYVTRSQFLRVLHQFDIYPRDEYLNVLLKHYTNNGNLNEVNYAQFCTDVDGQDSFSKSISDNHSSLFNDPRNAQGDVFKMRTQQMLSMREDFGTRRPEEFPRVNVNSKELEQIIQTIQIYVSERRIRISEFLKDFDRLRSGSITRAQLRIGMNMAKISFTEKEFNTLCNAFACDKKNGWFRWQDFCDTVDQVFGVKGLEADPEKSKTTLILPQVGIFVHRDKMSSESINLAHKIKDKFANFCLATRLHIKQFFQDWDKLGRNKVTDKQFRQVLATIKFDMTDPECKAICDFYRASDGYVNYLEFINDTNPDNYHRQSLVQSHATEFPVLSSPTYQPNSGIESKYGLATEQSKFFASQQFEPEETINLHRIQQAPSEYDSHIPNYSYMIDLSVDPIKILERIKRDVKISRTRLREYLQDFDGLRKGLVTQNKFFGSLDKLKIELTPSETEALKRIYSDESDPEKRIEYIRFCTDIDKVFTTKGLQKNPTYSVQEYKKPDFLNPQDFLTQEEEQVLHHNLIEMGNFVRINRILVKPFFKDKDVARSGKVSFPRFRAILDQLGVHFTEEGYRLLCKRFSHEGVEFNYVEFDEVLRKYANDNFYNKI